MVIQPHFGRGLALDELNTLEDYILFTMKEPWGLLKGKLDLPPIHLDFNSTMDAEDLTRLMERICPSDSDLLTVVGIGGGTSCDTAKYMAWWAYEQRGIDVDLILIPSIISVDAFLCSSIAVRVDNKVEYVGTSQPKKILIDYDLIQQAPKYLNRAGVSDTISITSALGDWKLERDEINGRFDQNVFYKARRIAVDLMDKREEIREVSEVGIKALVDGFYEEVKLCEAWGNARPEEGSEHFLAYCLESITGQHYIHGNLIGMNVLISLFLQEHYAEFSVEEIQRFFKDILIDISPEKQNITDDQIRKALSLIQSYAVKENLQYSVYNSPSLKLDKEKIEKILTFLKKNLT